MRYRNYPGFKLSPVLVLIVVNFLLFIATIVVPKLIIFLGLMPGDFLRPWTIVTSMFMHAGFWHIFANMLTLYFFGSYLSRLLGEGKFLLVYFGGGILGNILLLLLAPLFPFSILRSPFFRLQSPVPCY